MDDGARTVERIREGVRDQPVQNELREQVDLSVVAAEAVGIARERLGRRSDGTIHIELDLASGLPLISGSSSELQEVIVNLVVNAIALTPDPSPAGRGEPPPFRGLARSSDTDPADCQFCGVTDSYESRSVPDRRSFAALPPGGGAPLPAGEGSGVRVPRGTIARGQFEIGHYIVDFCCEEVRLIIELDGDGHFDPSVHSYDVRRTQDLQDLGYTVTRIENEELLVNPEIVLERIARLVGALKKLPHP